MAHHCPNCSDYCHCGGDIDDIVFDEVASCSHCSDRLNDDEYDEEYLEKQAEADYAVANPMEDFNYPTKEELAIEQMERYFKECKNILKQ